MKIVNESQKTSIFLEDKELLEISPVNGNHVKILIQCMGNTLHLEEENVNTFDSTDEEAKAIRALNVYLKKQKNK